MGPAARFPLAHPHPAMKRPPGQRGPPLRRLLARSALLGGLDDADQVPLGVVEEADLGAVRHLVRTHHPRPAEALGLGERGLDVGNLDVEGDVAVVSLRPGSDAAPDPDPVGVDVPLALHDSVFHRVVGVDLPPEEAGVEALKLVRVLPYHLELYYRLTHSFLLPGWDACITSYDYPRGRDSSHGTEHELAQAEADRHCRGAGVRGRGNLPRPAGRREGAEEAGQGARGPRLPHQHR